MSERQKSIFLASLLLATAAGGTYALGQAKPAPAKPETAKSEKSEASCDCAACQQDGSAANGGMHGKMGMGMKNDGESCPMMDNGGKPPPMVVEVENTAQGAVLKLNAKNAADVAKVQQMAQKMSAHLQEGCKMMDGGKMGPGKMGGSKMGPGKMGPGKMGTGK